MPLQSQLYLTGRLAGPPELGTTKKGKLWVKLLVETELVRQTQPGEFQTESVTVPISFFSRPAEQVKNLTSGATITVGAHLYGTKFENGGVTKHGVQLVADAVFTNSKGDPP
jgi:single-stranded DNA-binding protein